MKTSEIVTRALRKIRVVASDEPATADQIASGVDALNEMMHGWKAQGADVSHTDLAPSDDFSLSDEYRQATIMLLAQYLAGEYNRPPPDKFETDTLWSALQGAYWTDPIVKVDEGLTDMPSQQRYGYGRVNNA